MRERKVKDGIWEVFVGRTTEISLFETLPPPKEPWGLQAPKKLQPAENEEKTSVTGQEKLIIPLSESPAGAHPPTSSTINRK